jgi:hypothetical protein
MYFMGCTLKTDSVQSYWAGILLIDTGNNRGGRARRDGPAAIPFLFYRRPATGLYRTAMYFFFHLLAGTILGLLIGDIFRDYRWAIPCAIGSVLPDLVDKPLDLVIFSQSIGNGYIYGHTLLAALALGVLGLLILIVWKNPIIAGIAAGIFSHQVLDLMWREPKSWFFPAYGAFPRPTHISDIITLLMNEIHNPLEIFLFIFLCAGIGVFIFRYRITTFIARHIVGIRILLACGVFGFCILSGVFIGLTWGKHTIPSLAWTRPEDFILGSIVAAMAAVLLWRWYHTAPDMKRV